jgi:hypothetical protein
VNGNGIVWKQLTDKVEAEQSKLRKRLDGNALFTGMLHLYAAIHGEITLQTDLKKTRVRKSPDHG